LIVVAQISVVELQRGGANDDGTLRFPAAKPLGFVLAREKIRLFFA
jgi:hypothetical protein